MNPTDNLEILLAGAYGDRRETIALYGNPLNGNTNTRNQPNAIIPTRPFDVALSDGAKPQRIKSYDLSGRVELTLPAGTLTSITAWLQRKVDGVIDADYAYAPNGQTTNYYTKSLDRYFSQEVNYASDLDGALNFVVGAFYTNGKGVWDGLDVASVQPGGTPVFGATIFGDQKVKSVAAFGEVYFDVTDRIRLIGGLRYSWEKRTFNGTTLLAPFSPKPTLPRIDQRSWDSFTPRASIRYELTPTSNVYFTFSQGFKSGVYNTNNTFALVPDVANPEKITSYEAGFKGRIGDMLTLDLAGFYYDYKNLQVTVTREVIPSVSLSTIQNAAAARVYGLEADATLRLSDMFDFRAAGAYIDAKYKRYPNGEVYAANPGSNGNTVVPFPANGQRLPRAPKFTGTFTANGHFDVGGGKLDLSATAYYSSRFNLVLDGRIAQRNYVTLDARAAWSPENSGFTVAVFGKNLNDRTLLSGAFITDNADGVSWAPPRTYGVQVDYKF